MWTESSSVNSANLVKYICYNVRDIKFFLGGYFFLVRPVYHAPVNLYTGN